MCETSARVPASVALQLESGSWPPNMAGALPRLLSAAGDVLTLLEAPLQGRFEVRVVGDQQREAMRV